MKKFIISLGITTAFLAQSVLAQSVTNTTTTIPYAPKEEKTSLGDKDVTTTTTTKKTTLKGDDCPPVDTKTKPDCPKPKPKPKPKPTPKPVPTPKAKPCPEQKPCPTCEPKVIERTKTETKYLDRTVTIDNAPKNTFSVLAGIGPHGIVTDYYETKDRQDEYTFRKEKEKPDGALIGIQYQYRLTPTFGIGAMGLTNKTFMASGSVSW